MKKIFLIMLSVFLFTLVSCSKHEKAVLTDTDASNINTIKNEDKTVPSEDKPAPSEDKPAPSEDKPAPSEAKSAPSEDKPAPSEAETAIQQKAVIEDDDADDTVEVDENYVEDEDADFEYKYLAINPEDCVVTYCDKYPGAEKRGFACNTKKIVEAGFFLGATTYRVGTIIRGGRDCAYQGEEWKCFLDKDKYVNYIKKHALDCAYDQKKECLVETDECVPQADDELEVDD